MSSQLKSLPVSAGASGALNAQKPYPPGPSSTGPLSSFDQLEVLSRFGTGYEA